MKFLEQLPAKVKVNARSKEVASQREHIASLEGEAPRGVEGGRPQVSARMADVLRRMGQEALPRLRESLADAERLLATRGDTTKLTVSQLPSKGGRITERESVWWIPSNDWEASVETPIRIAATAEHIKYYSAGSDIGTDDDDDEPVLFILWIVEGKVFLANDDDLTPGDVKALVNQQKSTRRLALEKAHALQAMTEQLDKPRRRGRIPQEVRIEVWQHDQGRCVECKSQNDLEFDHIIPFGMGGSNTARNLQLLCGSCNRVKGMTLG